MYHSGKVLRLRLSSLYKSLDWRSEARAEEGGILLNRHLSDLKNKVGGQRGVYACASVENDGGYPVHSAAPPNLELVPSFSRLHNWGAISI